MIDLFLLMILGKGQESFGKAWQWAILFTLLGLPFGGAAPLFLLLRFGFSWLYFSLLKRFQEQEFIWFVIYVSFPFALFLLSFFV